MSKAAGKVPQKAAGASEPSPAVQAPPEPADAPAPLSEHSAAVPGDELGLAPEMEAQAGEGDGTVKPQDETSAVASRMDDDEKDAVSITDPMARPPAAGRE